MKKLPAIVIWAVAFGYVEAAVVEYLRALYSPLDMGGFRFPVLTLAEIQDLGAEHVRRIVIELRRELATLVMPATLAAAVAGNRREGWAVFGIAFGIWDLTYYLWLKIFLDWPPSLFTTDLLFLIPVPWVGPVLAPCLVSLVLVACGTIVLMCEDRGRALIATWTDWGLMTSGGLIVIVAFCRNYADVMAGVAPGPFPWMLFAVGLGLGVGAFGNVVHRGLFKDCSESAR